MYIQHLKFCSPFQTPFNVNLLIAGYDNEKAECQFYVLDYLASMVTTKFAAHGYGGFFATALMDNKYNASKFMTEYFSTKHGQTMGSEIWKPNHLKS